MLSLLGASRTRTLLPAQSGENELGFWEPERIVRVHEEILGSLGSSWDDVSPIPSGWFESELARAYEHRLVGLLKEEFGDAPLFVLNDPRIRRLVPLWTSALDRFGADPSFVILIRNPLEVAASIRDRNGFGSGKSLLLWLSHLLEVERDTRQSPRTFLSYEGLLRDWRRAAERISADLSITFPRLIDEAHGEVEQFLDLGLRHNFFSASEIEALPDVTKWVADAFRAALEASEEEMRDVFDAIRAEVDRANEAYALSVNVT